MRIGIDARMLGPLVGGGGLGRYVEELVRELGKLDHKNRYVFFTKDNTPIHWYTLKEQIALPRRIDREHLDLVHFPHWNVPILLRTPFVVTIHDLILLEEPRSAKITTRHPFIFAIKRLGYRLVLRSAIKRARAIIAVSHYTKASILKHFPWVNPQKIHVVYEGLTRLPNHPNPPTPPNPFLLYVGNAYPHKNLETLLAAFQSLIDRHPQLTLTLAGRNDIFYQRLQSKTREMGIGSRVRFVLDATDTQLAELYRTCTLYVFPSRNEGFGLPPLEAMSQGLPVASSSAGSLPEILGEAAIFFDPLNAHDMAQAIEQGLTNTSLRQHLIETGRQQAARYSWEKMAQNIIDIYQAHAS